MHRIFVGHDPIEAHFVHDLLERAGIAAEIRGEGLFGLRPSIGIDTDSLPSVWVIQDTALQTARDLVADYEANKEAPAEVNER